LNQVPLGDVSTGGHVIAITCQHAGIDVSGLLVAATDASAMGVDVEPTPRLVQKKPLEV
jgi:hypothetical protein